ncbi:MAG: hypothetical protein HQL30_08090 [Candidatus Omnitrophica bacterium]|nr:hypothetical protein [Candidatus Omnitrophota bacterium]
MQILSAGKDESKVQYKTTFTTSEGIIHRVDFDNKGRIENLCEYTKFSPNLSVKDLETLVVSIKEIIGN